MGLLRRRQEQPAPQAPTIRQSLDALVQTAAKPSVFAHSEFVKQVSCAQCGAPKRLPSLTAYLYCDHCGALIDYDFRLANSGTNAGLTNTVYHRLVAQVQGQLDLARRAGDQATYRQLLHGVFDEWLRQCPEAASPRARSDPEFRARMVSYLTESSVLKDFDFSIVVLEGQLNSAIAGLQRRPAGDGAWQTSDGIWHVAELFKDFIEQVYQKLHDAGVSAMDPDEAPLSVQRRMEYSTFCQGWVTHMPAADGERLLAMFGLSGQYARADTSAAITKRCGGCGNEALTLAESTAVVCQFCGRKLDIAGGEVPCGGCGAPLSLPVGTDRLECPYCKTGTARV